MIYVHSFCVHNYGLLLYILLWGFNNYEVYQNTYQQASEYWKSSNNLFYRLQETSNTNKEESALKSRKNSLQ